MKTVIVSFIIGGMVGALAMSYRDDADFRAVTKAHIDSAVAQGAQTAHNALTGSTASTAPVNSSK